MSKPTAVFEQQGDFAAYRAACAWCDERGISHGSMQAHSPIGLLLGDFAIAKWRNLRQADRDALDGMMLGDFRSGPVRVHLNGDVVRRLQEQST